MISIFKDLNQFAGRWKILDLLAIFCARFLPVLLVIFLFLYSLYISDFYLFIYVIISALLGLAINRFIRIFYKEKRPAYIKGAKVLIPVPKDYSFPSGHSSFFFGISFFLFYYNFYLALAFIIISLFIAVARVFCGVHWFRDILSGIVVGFISSVVVHSLVNYIKF